MMECTRTSTSSNLKSPSPLPPHRFRDKTGVRAPIPPSTWINPYSLTMMIMTINMITIHRHIHRTMMLIHRNRYNPTPLLNTNNNNNNNNKRNNNNNNNNNIAINNNTNNNNTNNTITTNNNTTKNNNTTNTQPSKT